jgi:hypothetical protein
MKIYYELNELDHCVSKCPFYYVGVNGRNGLDCRVGSVTCQNCKYCYGSHEGGLVGYPGEDRIRFDHDRYIQCMYPAPTLYKKLLRKYKKLIGEL